MIEALKSDEIVHKVGGRFKLTALIQKRMLELMDGARPLVERGNMTDLEVVVQEIIQDKIYVTYSSNVGATTPEQVLRLEYVLDKHFSLVGEQNEVGSIGADVKFRFEFK